MYVRTWWHCKSKFIRSLTFWIFYLISFPPRRKHQRICNRIKTQFDLIKFDWEKNFVCTWCISFVWMLHRPEDGLIYLLLRESCHEQKNKPTDSFLGSKFDIKIQTVLHGSWILNSICRHVQFYRSIKTAAILCKKDISLIFFIFEGMGKSHKNFKY